MSYQILDNKISRFTNNTIFFLAAVCFVAVVIRFYYFPHGIPLSLDTLSYFFYANDVSILGELPAGYHFPNNGWPVFVSFFFSMFHSSNLLDYMDLQRYISITLSIVTVVPVYFLCKRFVEKKYCLLGAALFVFDPRIIQNSIQGDTQPLFILLSAVALALFFSNNIRTTYIAFSIAALSSLIRYEGLLLLIPFSVMFIIRFRKEPKIILKCCFVVVIVLAIIGPVSYFRTTSIGNDGLTSQVVGGAVAADILIKENGENGGINFILNGFINLTKSLGWILIPIFIFFVPIGVFYFVRKKEQKHAAIIFMLLMMLIPALYAYSRDIRELRYLFIVFPILCVFSSFAIERLLDKNNGKNIILTAIICGIIIASLGFLDYKKINYDHEREAYEISKHISRITKVTNDYYPETKYTRLPVDMQGLPTVFNGTKFGPEFIPVEGFDSLEKFIESSNNRLDHLVLDGAESRPTFLNDVYYNKREYPYLIKEFDSTELGYRYHMIIYKIDYEKFVEYKVQSTSMSQN